MAKVVAEVLKTLFFFILFYVIFQHGLKDREVWIQCTTAASTNLYEGFKNQSPKRITIFERVSSTRPSIASRVSANRHGSILCKRQLIRG